MNYIRIGVWLFFDEFFFPDALATAHDSRSLLDLDSIRDLYSVVVTLWFGRESGATT